MADLENLLLQAAGRTGASGRKNNHSHPQSRWQREGSSSDVSDSKDDDSDNPRYNKRKPAGSQVPLKKRLDLPEKDKRSGWGDDNDDDDDRHSSDESDSAPSFGSGLYRDEADKEELGKMSEVDRELILAERSIKIDDYKFKKMARALSKTDKSRRLVAMAAAKWSETAMLVIDMQNDFILPEMESPVLVAGGEAIISSVVKAVSVARERGIFMIWVVREHDHLGRDVELFRRHWYSNGKGPTVKGAKGAALVDGLTIKEGEYKLVKTRFSAFFATHLHSLLQSSGIKSLVIVGVQTPNCIRQTVFDAVALDYRTVTVVVDATAAATPEIHSANIRDMKNIGVLTPTLQEWCSFDA